MKPLKRNATQINGISFLASDEAIAQAQKQALREATLDAQQQANTVFTTLGIKPKEVVSIQVNGASATTPPQPLLRTAVTKTGTQDASTSVISGEQLEDASVTLEIS